MSDLVSFFAGMWQWVRQDIFGSDIIGGYAILVWFVMAFISLDLPPQVVTAFLVPATIALVMLAFLGWFGWIIILLAGYTFGVTMYKAMTGGI